MSTSSTNYRFTIVVNFCPQCFFIYGILFLFDKWKKELPIRQPLWPCNHTIPMLHSMRYTSSSAKSSTSSTSLIAWLSQTNSPPLSSFDKRSSTLAIIFFASSLSSVQHLLSAELWDANSSFRIFIISSSRRKVTLVFIVFFC